MSPCRSSWPEPRPRPARPRRRSRRGRGGTGGCRRRARRRRTCRAASPRSPRRPVVVAERVDVCGGMVRGDDDLGAERRPSLRPRRRAGCGAGSASGGRTGAAATRARAAATGRSRDGHAPRACQDKSWRGSLSRGISAARFPFRPSPCTPGRCAGRSPRRSARPSRRWRGVASPTTPDGCDVAEHVHWDDDASGPCRRIPYWPKDVHGSPASFTAAPRSQASRVACSVCDALAERQRERRLRLLGVDHRALDLREYVGREVPPLDEEDAPARRLEVVVHGDGECGDVAAVPVHRDEVARSRGGRASRRPPGRPGGRSASTAACEPGNCMWYQDSVTFSVGATSRLTPSASPASAARAQSERAMKQSVSSGMCGPCCSVVPIGISTASTPRCDRCRRPPPRSSAR